MLSVDKSRVAEKPLKDGSRCQDAAKSSTARESGPSWSVKGLYTTVSGEADSRTRMATAAACCGKAPAWRSTRAKWYIRCNC